MLRIFIANQLLGEKKVNGAGILALSLPSCARRRIQCAMHLDVNLPSRKF